MQGSQSEVQPKGSIREEVTMESFAGKVRTTLRATGLDSRNGGQPAFKALTVVCAHPCAHTREKAQNFEII